MENTVTVEVSITKLVCNDCRIEQPIEKAVDKERDYSLAIVEIAGADDSAPITIPLDVKRIEWLKKDKGHYVAFALLSVLCPSCGKPKELRHQMEAPVIFLTDIGVCRNCGGRLSLENELIEYVDSDGNDPLLAIRGDLICHYCMTEAKQDLQVFSSEFPAIIRNKDIEIRLTEQGAIINDVSMEGIRHIEARSELRHKLNIYFNNSELHELCFDLGVDFESLVGHNKNEKLMGLITYLERRNRLSELLETCSKLRPNTIW